MKDNQGLLVSTASATALDGLNKAISALLEYRLTAMPLIKIAINEDQSFCMAHCLRGYMLMMFGTFSVYGNARDALGNATTHMASATERERQHVAALELWLEGDLRQACMRWEWILAENPLDILALRMHHFNSFWMGRPQALQSAPASVLQSWSADVPHYGNVLGMLAFGLEENGQYEAAERYGREAVARNPNDLWGVHSVAHVLEMQNRHDEGTDWLAFSDERWSDRNPFRSHLWWHLGLFLIAQRRYDEAVALYDSAIHNKNSDFYLDIQNAASFLARLEFEKVTTGNRWAALADHADLHRDDHALVFTDIHCVMSLARERRFAQADKLIDSMMRYARESDFHVPQVIRRVGVQACRGIVAFEQGEYLQALALILPLRPQLFEVGASHAQRDVIVQYALEAARRGGLSKVVDHLSREQRFMTRLAQGGPLASVACQA